MEKNQRSAKGSPSPHRLSPSPRSGTSPLQSRSRPFSATHSSPPPSLRHSSPSRGLSPPPSKPTPPPKSSSPTPRRMSTGSLGPTKPSRGNSSSPKIRAWQSNIPGFSSEAPPNLRTSLADRPASYVRGSSPASGRSGRQSMSPTASRSVSSSHSHERDQFSSYSKGSVASSGDDDVDSIQSNVVSSSDRSIPRRLDASPNNRAMGFSKKPSKVLSSSAPKRSFDLALRQMERKCPQNMFRPLLSSVPSSTFYAGKVNTNNRSLVSRNSSITTSSNASSDQGTSGPLDTEESSEQNQEDVTSDFTKGQQQYPTAHDELFVMDQDNAPNEALVNRMLGEPPDLENENDESSRQVYTATAVDPVDVVSDRIHDYSDNDNDGDPDTEICSKCNSEFRSSDLLREGDAWLCSGCKSLEETLMADMNTTRDFVPILECGPIEVLDLSASSPDSLQDTNLDSITNGGQHSNIDPVKNLEGELSVAAHEEIDQSATNVETGDQEISSDSKGDVCEGTGISVLLKQLSSRKENIVQSRSFTASNVSYDDDLSYVRDSVNSMRSSSVSSSMDLGSSRQTETRIHRQSSSKKSDAENYRFDTPTKHKRSVSSLSGAGNKDKEVCGVTCEQSLASECTEAESTCTDVESNIIDKTDAELSNHLTGVVHSGGTSVVSNLTCEDPALLENGDELRNISSNSINEETLAADIQASTQTEDAVESSLDDLSEMEIGDADVDSTNSKIRTDNELLLDPSVSSACNDIIMATTVEEFDASVPVHDVLEESTVVLENLDGTKARSLTLEEATNAILFCSSIVHNLAYEAANIAINKEHTPPPPVESLRPAVTFVGKSNSDRRDNNARSRTLGKRSSKSQKARQKRLETDVKTPPVVAESDEKSTPRIVMSPSKKWDSINPPKLESKCNCTIM
ncbi:hypothetical protein ABFX02_11G067300 [Erythranthe guttata]